MIYGDKNFRKVLVATAANGSARASADLLADGEIQAFNVSGTGAAAAGERFAVFSNVGGVISSSDIIDPAKVISSKTADYADQVQQVSTITIAGTVTAGDSWEATIRLRDYGMTSAFDYTNVYAQYVALSGDTVDNVAAGLAAAFNQSIATHGGTINIVASSSTADLILTGTATEYKVFQFDGRPHYFNASVTNPENIAEVINPAVSIGSGVGTEMYSLEYFSKMVTGDPYADSEIKFVAPLQTSTAGEYNVIEISYYGERTEAPGDKQRKVLTLVVDSATVLISQNAQITAPLQTIGLALADTTIGTV